MKTQRRDWKSCAGFHHGLRTTGARNKGIVNDPIVLTVYATGAPDLTLIDLPLGPTEKNTGDGERICRKMGAWKNYAKVWYGFMVHDVHPRKLTWEWTNNYEWRCISYYKWDDFPLPGGITCHGPRPGVTRVPLKGSDQAGRSGRPVPGMMLNKFPLGQF